MKSSLLLLGAAGALLVRCWCAAGRCWCADAGALLGAAAGALLGAAAGALLGAAAGALRGAGARLLGAAAGAPSLCVLPYMSSRCSCRGEMPTRRLH